MIKLAVKLCLLILVSKFYAQSNTNPSPKENSLEVTEAYFNRNSIPTVAIGTQAWTNKNLDVTTYRNGDVIPEVTDPTQWKNLKTGAWCYYNNNASNNATYGKLYNWYAVNDPRGLAPEGFHIPTSDEWMLLINYLGGNTVAGGKLKEMGTTNWNSPNKDATNSSGFTAVGTGNRTDLGNFTQFKNSATFWTSSLFYDDFSFLYSINYNSAGANRNNSLKTYGIAVRCIADAGLSRPSYSDKMNGFTIYPNPVTDILSLNYKGIDSTNIHVEILTLEGRLVLEKDFKPSNSIKIGLENVSKGMYLCKISSNGKQQKIKFLKH